MCRLSHGFLTHISLPMMKTLLIWERVLPGSVNNEKLIGKGTWLVFWRFSSYVGHKRNKQDIDALLPINFFLSFSHHTQLQLIGDFYFQLMPLQILYVHPPYDTSEITSSSF